MKLGLTKMMSNSKKTAGTLAIFAALLTGQTAFGAEYLVKYRQNSLAFTTLNAGFNSAMKLQVLDHNNTAQLIKVGINKADTLSALLALSSNPNIEYVVPNFKLYSFSTVPVDIGAEALQPQWAIQKVNAEKAWQKAGNRGSKNIKIAVIDTGVDYRHGSLASNMTPGYDFAGNDADPMDETGSKNPGHGTHCAGIIGANGVVDGGTVGMSPEVTMMALRFLDKNGSGDLNNGIKAIDYAIEKKVDIISASWGAAVSRQMAKPLIEAVERAGKAGITFVVAAANDGKNNDSYEVYPANAGFPNTIVVAASGSSDAKPSWSNYGRARVHVSSPGEGILSTLPGDKYGNLSGTSMATPLVAGLVGFLKAQDPTLNSVQLRALLQATGAKVGIQTACDCRVDAEAAVDTILAKKMFVAPNAGTLAVGETMAISGVYGKGPFQFASANADVASIDAQGTLTAKKEGETTVTVRDSAGQSATSYKFYVGKASSGTDPGQPGQPGGECPFGDQATCDLLCQIQPTLPFCKK